MSLFTSSKHAVEGFPMIPGSNIVLGHLHLMREDDFRVSLHKFSVEHADEDGRVCFWMGSIPALSVTRAKDVQHVLLHSSHRTVFSLMKRHAQAFLGKHNLSMISGKEWKAQRGAVVKALHATANLESHARAVVETTQEMVYALKQRTSSNKNEPMEIVQLMKMLTLDTFGRAALGVDFGCISSFQLSEIATSFEYLMSEMMRRMTWGMMDPTTYSYSLPTLSNWKHAKHKQIVRGHVTRLIKERRSENETGNDKNDRQDLLSELMKVYKQSSGDDDTDETLTDVLMSLLFAGYETSSVTLAYALYLVSQHEQVEAKLFEEIQANDEEQPQSWESYHYVRAVLMETLRLYPPAISTTRSLEKPLVLDGTTIPQGTYLYVPIWTVQRDANNFDNPDSFLPERWLDSNDGTFDAAATNKAGFVAFSAGARSCAGQRFAMMETILSLVILLRNYEFHALPDYVLTPHRDGIVQTPKGGLAMIITCRE